MKRSVRTRRTAAVSATGLFLMAGAAVIAAPAATAAPNHGVGVTQVGVCHATSSDTNPYEWLLVDDDSVQLAGHMGHKTEPNKTWKNAGSWNGMAHEAGDAKPDYIGGDISEQWCLASAVVTDEENGDDDAEEPTDENTDEPSDENTDEPSDENTDEPTDENTDEPTDENTEQPTDENTEQPTDEPSTPTTDVESDSQEIPATGGTTASAELAHTGAASTVMLGLGAVLVATGLVFVVAGRKPEVDAA